MTRRSSIVFVILALGRVPASLAGDVTAPETQVQARQAVARAIDYLQKESAAWLSSRRCAACHHAPLPFWALSEARQRGYAIDEKALAHTMDSMLGSRDGLIAAQLLPDPASPPDPRPQGRGLNMGLPLVAIAARSSPSLEGGSTSGLQLIADEIVQKQQADGSWEFFATLRRPPINENQFTDAVWIVLALAAETGPDAPESQRTALSKAIAWLDAAPASDIHQEKVLTLLLGARLNAPRESLQGMVDELIALQRPDGGWSQTIPEPQSDAFATGQTLYVLSLFGYSADQPSIQRGLAFLVATQLPDGSWPMTSRSTPDGSPGSATLLTPITCAASSWAVLGVARLVPAGE